MDMRRSGKGIVWIWEGPGKEKYTYGKVRERKAIDMRSSGKGRVWI